MLGTFEYTRPRDLDEACRVLAEASGEARVLAGGTDLFVELRNGVRTPDLLIDIKGLEALRRIEHSDRVLRIGAAVPLNAIAETSAVREAAGGLVDALLSIGTYQLRNRATLAGNLCNGSPAADSAPMLLALGASVVAQSRKGERTIPLDEFFLGAKRTCLSPTELVTAVEIPQSPHTTRTAFVKQQRIRGHDLALVNVAGTYVPATGTLRIAIGSCGPTPILLPEIDVHSVGLPRLAREAVALALRSVSPIDDVRSSASYRLAVLETWIERLIDRLIGEGGGL